MTENLKPILIVSVVAESKFLPNFYLLSCLTNTNRVQLWYLLCFEHKLLSKQKSLYIKQKVWKSLSSVCHLITLPCLHDSDNLQNRYWSLLILIIILLIIQSLANLFQLSQHLHNDSLQVVNWLSRKWTHHLGQGRSDKKSSSKFCFYLSLLPFPQPHSHYTWPITGNSVNSFC